MTVRRAHAGFATKRHHAARARCGHVFVISGPSGGGKTTIVERVQAKLPHLVRSVSLTTRTPRANERQGRDYRFVSRNTFARLRESGQLLEWARVHGADYGTPKRPVQRALGRGRDIILSIDVQGARKVRQALGQQAVFVFLLPPSEAQLRQRLLQRRTETPAMIRRRLATAKREIACARWYDYQVVNDQLPRAVTRVVAIMRAHRSVGKPITRRQRTRVVSGT